MLSKDVEVCASVRMCMCMPVHIQAFTDLKLVPHSGNALERDAVVTMNPHVVHKTAVHDPLGCDDPIEHDRFDC